jgi:hypothetical protein
VATICGVWIVAALFAIPSALSKFTCYISGFAEDMTYYQFVVFFELTVSCVIPLCVIAFTYIMTARHLLKSADPISQETQNPQLNTRKYYEKIVLGLTIVFLISFVPNHALWTHSVYTANQKNYEETGFITLHRPNNLPYIYLVSIHLLLSNVCLSPVVLFCTSHDFRRHLKRYISCNCKTNSQVTDLELTIRN